MWPTTVVPAVAAPRATSSVVFTAVPDTVPDAVIVVAPLAKGSAPRNWIRAVPAESVKVWPVEGLRVSPVPETLMFAVRESGEVFSS